MTLYTKKQSREQKADRNILSLNRYKRGTHISLKKKQTELKIFTKDEEDGMFLLQQMGIRRGNKSASVKRANNILLTLKKKFPNRDAHALVTDLLMQYRTLIYLRSKKLGSVTYKIPISLFKGKGMRVVARWLMSNDKPKKSKDTREAYKEQLVNLLRKQSDILKKRYELHKLGFSGIPYLTYIKRDTKRA